MIITIENTNIITNRFYDISITPYGKEYNISYDEHHENTEENTIKEDIMILRLLNNKSKYEKKFIGVNTRSSLNMLKNYPWLVNTKRPLIVGRYNRKIELRIFELNDEITIPPLFVSKLITSMERKYLYIFDYVSKNIISDLLHNNEKITRSIYENLIITEKGLQSKSKQLDIKMENHIIEAYQHYIINMLLIAINTEEQSNITSQIRKLLSSYYYIDHYTEADRITKKRNSEFLKDILFPFFVELNITFDQLIELEEIAYNALIKDAIGKPMLDKLNHNLSNFIMTLKDTSHYREYKEDTTSDNFNILRTNMISLMNI